MPIRYAVQQQRSTQLSDEERSRLLASGYNEAEMIYEYSEVPQGVAEVDESGYYAVFATSGHKISAWVPATSDAILEKAWRTGRAKPGPTLRDSIQQKINHGDYVFMVSKNYQTLELGRIVRNLATKVEIELLSEERAQGAKPLVRRDPYNLLKVPLGWIEEGVPVPSQSWTQRYASSRGTEFKLETVSHENERLRDNSMPNIFKDSAGNHLDWYGRYFEFYEDNIAKLPSESRDFAKEDAVHTGLFNDENLLITGWIPLKPRVWIEDGLVNDWHAGKEIYRSEEIVFIDALGSEIRLGDMVFSHNNQAKMFMPSKVVGFSKDRVQLLECRNEHIRYDFQYNSTTFDGTYNLTLNTPTTIVKLPINYTFNFNFDFMS